MKIHELPSVTTRSKKRLGQGHGSGRGKTSGRGTKGQKARNKVPLRFEGGALVLVKRLPFLRGKGRNNALQQQPDVVTLDMLAKLPVKTIVTVESLVKHGILSEKNNGVKILGTGSVSHAYTIKVPASKSARAKIEKAGGSVETA